MKRFYIVILILFLLCGQAFPLSFQTERIKATYELLNKQYPVEIKNATGSSREIIMLEIDSTSVPLSVYFNREKELAHLGISLGKDFMLENMYSDAYLFLENSLLNLLLLPTEKERMEYAEKMQLRFYVNNEPVDVLKNSSSLIGLLDGLQFDFFYFDYYHEAVWTLKQADEAERLVVRFPTVLSFLKGMDKVEMELDFVQGIKTDEICELFLLEYENPAEQLENNLYRQLGKRFESDNFRSDIYFTKDSMGAFTPVFTREFPIESFANLFLCSMENSFEAEVNCKLYGTEKKIYCSFNNIKYYLSQHKETYFGIQPSAGDLLKATIIFYSPQYKYIHMAVAEIEREALFFSKGEKIKMDLYFFIPRTDINKMKI